MANQRQPLILSGKSISPGLAEGITFVHTDTLAELEAPVGIESEGIEQELGQLDSATAALSTDLLALAERVEKQMDARLAAVFEAHQLILNDPTLRQELREEIQQNLVSASTAVRAVFLRWEKRFLVMESQVARHKGDDMRDLSDRLSEALAGIKVHPLENVPPGSILVARRLLPSDTTFLSRNSVAAVLLERGSAGSHAALFTREMGVPCIAGISRIHHRIPKGAEALVDARKAEAILHPNDAQKSEFRQKRAAQSEASRAMAARARERALTRNGVAVEVLANVGCRADTERAMANGADGVGLYRTERAYLGRATPPEADELLADMRDTLEPAKGRPVYVRLLDVGADKPLPFIGFLAESNPALGRRGVRLLQEYPKLLDIQLRAILDLSRDFDLRLLVPMVTTPEDLAFVREALKRQASPIGKGSLFPVGAMIETPAAALSAVRLAEQADFLSFGTNDLTQYVFAADRDNVAVERYFADSSDIIFRLLKIVHADAPNLPLSICGELAGNVAQLGRILDCGIQSLSVAPPLIPDVKEAIRQCAGPEA